MLGFAHLEGKTRSAHTWWVLFAGYGPDEGLGTVGAGGRPVVSTREKERVRVRVRAHEGW